MQRTKAQSQNDIDYIVTVLGCCSFIADAHGKESVAAEMAEAKLSGFSMASIKSVSKDSIQVGKAFWDAFARLIRQS